jgi:hypothetical protein
MTLHEAFKTLTDCTTFALWAAFGCFFVLSIVVGMTFAWIAFNFVVDELTPLRMILAAVSFAAVVWLSFLAKEKFDQ